MSQQQVMYPSGVYVDESGSAWHCSVPAQPDPGAGQWLIYFLASSGWQSIQATKVAPADPLVAGWYPTSGPVFSYPK